MTGADTESVASRRPARVRVVFYCDSHTRGGAEMSVRNLLSALSPSIDAVVVGTDPQVVAWMGAARSSCATLVLPTIHGRWSIGAIAAHVRAFRRLRPAIIQVSLSDPWSSHWAVLAAICARSARVLVVEQTAWRTNNRRRRVLKRLIARGLAAQVAVGVASARAAAAFSGLPRDRVHVIHNGVPDDDVAPLPRAELGPIVGAVGRLEYEKGYDVLIRAITDVPATTVVLVGEGRLERELSELADELGVRERVRFLGWSDEPRRHVSTFDVVVLPSRIEAFPLVIVEAMLAGVPVVAAGVGSVSDAVLDGVTGLLVPPEDPDALSAALRTLLADPELTRRMGRQGLEHARLHFTADVMAARYEQLYADLLR